MDEVDQIVERCMRSSKDVRYAAVYSSGELVSRVREGLSGASSSESDRYEELQVNPTLIELASPCGNIDCGGLGFLLVRYGNFFQFVHPTKDGHVSVALEPSWIS